MSALTSGDGLKPLSSTLAVPDDMTVSRSSASTAPSKLITTNTSASCSPRLPSAQPADVAQIAPWSALLAAKTSPARIERCDVGRQEQRSLVRGDAAQRGYGAGHQGHINLRIRTILGNQVWRCACTSAEDREGLPGLVGYTAWSCGKGERLGVTESSGYLYHRCMWCGRE